MTAATPAFAAPPAAAPGRLVATSLETLALAVIALALLPPTLRTDDAWIYFRYAANLAAGEGLVFNIGESLHGATSPLYAILLGGIAWSTGATVPAAAAFLHVVSLTAAGLAVSTILHRRIGSLELPRRALGAVFVLALGAHPWTVETAGMEATLYVAVALWLAHALRSAAELRVGVLAALLPLIRPDAVLLAGVAFVALCALERRVSWRALAAGSFVGVPWLLYSTLVFGSPLPSSAGAKIDQAESMLWTDRYGRTLIEEALAPEFLPITVLAVVGTLIAIARRERAALLIVAWAVLHNGVFTAFGIPSYRWYFVPFFAQALFLSTFALERTLLRLAIDRFSLWARRLDAAAMLSAVVAAGFMHGTRPWLPNDLAPRDDRYHAIGRFLATKTPPDARVAMIEVGIVGYFSERYVVDLLGLVSPGVAPHVRDRSHVAYAMERFDPDYFLRHVPFAPKGHEQGLERFVDHGFVPVYARGDTEVWMRVEGDEVAFAERLLASVEERDGRLVLLPELPRWLDHGAIERTTSAATPPLRTTNDRETPGITHVATLRGDGGFDVAPFDSVARMFDAASFAANFEAIGIVPGEGEQAGLFGVPDAAAHFRATLDLDGPVRRIRLRVRVVSLFGTEKVHGRLVWTSDSAPLPSPVSEAGFTLAETGGGEPLEIVLEIPRAHVGEDATIRHVLLFPADGPAGIAIESVTFERY
jgi:arabinofuranosyltransferase